MSNELEWQSEENKTLADVLNKAIRENVDLKTKVMRLEAKIEYKEEQMAQANFMMHEMVTHYDREIKILDKKLKEALAV